MRRALHGALRYWIVEITPARSKCFASPCTTTLRNERASAPLSARRAAIDVPATHRFRCRAHSGRADRISVKGWIRSDRAVDGAVDLAVRFPVGLCYRSDAAPVDVFAETVPAIGLLPATCFDLDFARGGRYWP